MSAASDAANVPGFELVLVRHGRTEWNAGGRYQGHTDVPLDETGRRQARAIAHDLDGLDFALAVTSDLARARETAEIVLGPRALSLERDVRWREMRFGSWEGLTRAEIVERTPALRQSPAPRYVAPPDGESYAELDLRIGSALESVRARTPPGARALVATHAGPLHAVLRNLLGEAEAAALGVTFSPASITIFRVEARSAKLLALNRTPPPDERAGSLGSGE